MLTMGDRVKLSSFHNVSRNWMTGVREGNAMRRMTEDTYQVHTPHVSTRHWFENEG